MASDNSSMDGEVDTHWRESLDSKDNHVTEEDEFSGLWITLQYFKELRL